MLWVQEVLGDGIPGHPLPSSYPGSSVTRAHLCILFFSLHRANLKNQKEVCLDPEAPVIKKIIQKILDRYLLGF